MDEKALMDAIREIMREELEPVKDDIKDLKKDVKDLRAGQKNVIKRLPLRSSSVLSAMPRFCASSRYASG